MTTQVDVNTDRPTEDQVRAAWDYVEYARDEALARYGDILRRWMAAEGLTQAEAAERRGVSRDTLIRHLMTGERLAEHRRRKAEAARRARTNQEESDQ